jgi:hypothetical protein
VKTSWGIRTVLAAPGGPLGLNPRGASWVVFAGAPPPTNRISERRTITLVNAGRSGRVDTVGKISWKGFQRWWGKPRSTELLAGSGQREVTTLLRVQKRTPSGP